MDEFGKSRKQLIIGGVASHLLAGVTGFVGLLAWFKLRTVQAVLVVVSDVTVWAWRFIDMSTFMIFGLIWLIVVLFSQHYYQKGYEKGRLIRNFTFVTGIVFAVLALSSATIMIAMSAERTQSNIITMLIETAFAVALLGVHIWIRGKDKKMAAAVEHEDEDSLEDE